MSRANSTQPSLSEMNGSSSGQSMDLSMMSVMLLTRAPTGEGLSEKSDAVHNSTSEAGLELSELLSGTGIVEGRIALQVTKLSRAECSRGSFLRE